MNENARRGVVAPALIALVAAALIAAAAIAWGVGVYNDLVVRREAVSKAWAQVETQYQRRYDLIPNLVAAVKGSAKFEKETLSAVVEARSRVGSVNATKDVLNDPAAFKKFEDAQAGLGSALSRLLVVVEKYPELKTTQGFQGLQDQLEGTENRIGVARHDFNEAAQGYNVAIKMFPASLIAKSYGFTERPYFSAATEAGKAPAVSF